jgi:hypothetical protein
MDSQIQDCTLVTNVKLHSRKREYDSARPVNREETVRRCGMQCVQHLPFAHKEDMTNTSFIPLQCFRDL